LYINQLYCGRHSEGVNIVGVIDDNPALSRLNVYGFDVLGTLRRLEAIYQKTPFEEIIITCNDISNGKIQRLREFQKKNNVRLVAFVRELKEFSE
jgi:FlaA1/EpsC-like NDP-sugar epimerase